MDRIQKALEKAKRKQAEQALNSASSVKKVNAETVSLIDDEKIDASIHDIVYTQTKVLEASPTILESNRIIAGFYNHPKSSIYRMLRTQVLKQMRMNNWQTLAVTSPTSGEGKSLTAINLAIAMAMELNQTVLLIDMDLRNPSIAPKFGMKVDHGLKDYLQGDFPLRDVLVNPGIKRLVVLPGIGRAEDSAELLSSPKMTSLVEDIKSQYESRLIIFDLPPILQVDDVLLASNYFDCSLLVLEDGKNNESNIKKSLQMLEGMHLIGTVINKSERPPSHQNY